MRNHFKSLRFWYVDAVGCYLIAWAIAPADPLSRLITSLLLFAVWLAIRFLIARRLSRSK